MDWSLIESSFFRLLKALPLTLEVWFLSVTIGALLAMGIVWLRVSRFKSLRGIAQFYLFIFRGTPLLIQLFIIYYGLPQLGFRTYAPFLWQFFRDPFFCAVLSLALCTAAYSSEIFRGALASVPHGQIEAAKACGMSKFLTFRRVIFPNVLRQALPAYSTEVISMTKATALVSLVTLLDLMGEAMKIRSQTFATYTPLMVVGLIYFVLNYLIAKGFQFAEYRLSPHLRPRSSIKPVEVLL